MPWLSSLSENIVSYSVGRFYTECVNSTTYPEFSELERMDEKGLNSKEMIGFSKILRNTQKRRSVNLKVNFCVLCKFYADISAEAFLCLQRCIRLCMKPPHIGTRGEHGRQLLWAGTCSSEKKMRPCAFWGGHGRFSELKWMRL